MQTRTIDYGHGDDLFQGQLVLPEGARKPLPGVLVAHAWAGRDPFADGKARALAELGYVGFAHDVYGKGKRGKDNAECSALMTPLMEDRALLRQRLLLGLDTLRAQPEVDKDRVAAVGFCFGGLCVLDLARSGAGLRGVVSFHGLFAPLPLTLSPSPINAKVLALHGYDDPMATPDKLVAFANEMTAAGADWQLHAYGGTKHAFTNPAANDPAFGTVYSRQADLRSWEAMRAFLAEALS